MVKVSEPVGTMMWLGDGKVLGLHGSPKVFDMATGEVSHRWPDIASGEQLSSIIHHLPRLPPTALDPANRRFAIAADDRIRVVQC